MSLHYAVQRKADHWFWLGQNQWITVPQFARLFEFIEDANTIGQQECRLPVTEWIIVPVELDEEDRPGQPALWQANCERSMRGRAGQRELRELEAALLALPEKRLIGDRLTDDEGGVCAIGCYAKHKGLDLSRFDPYESDEVGVAAGMPRLVAWKVVELNDVTLDTVWAVAADPLNRPETAYQGGIPHVRDMTPEERYEKVLAWVRSRLR